MEVLPRTHLLLAVELGLLLLATGCRRRLKRGTAWVMTMTAPARVQARREHRLLRLLLTLALPTQPRFSQQRTESLPHLHLLLLRLLL